MFSSRHHHHALRAHKSGSFNAPLGHLSVFGVGKFARMLWEDAHPLKHQMLLDTGLIDRCFHSVCIYFYFWLINVYEIPTVWSKYTEKEKENIMGKSMVKPSSKPKVLLVHTAGQEKKKKIKPNPIKSLWHHTWALTTFAALNISASSYSVSGACIWEASLALIPRCQMNRKGPVSWSLCGFYAHVLIRERAVLTISPRAFVNLLHQKPEATTPVLLYNREGNMHDLWKTTRPCRLKEAASAILRCFWRGKRFIIKAHFWLGGHWMSCKHIMCITHLCCCTGLWVC